MASMWDRSGYFYSLLPMITCNGVPVQVRAAAGHFSRLRRLVSSTSHIKMFWQDHEKFPECWRGHAAHEPPLTSRIKCLNASASRQHVIWTSAHLRATTEWSKGKVFIFHCLCFVFTVPYLSEPDYIFYCKRNISIDRCWLCKYVDMLFPMLGHRLMLW